MMVSFAELGYPYFFSNACQAKVLNIKFNWAMTNGHQTFLTMDCL